MKFNVLVVSSHTEEIKTIQGILNKQTFRCVTAETYRNAVKELCWNSFDAVVCDDYLRDGSWQDIIGQVSALTAAPAIIVLAKDSTYRDREIARELGAFEVIYKPVQGPELLNVLQAACANGCAGSLQEAVH